jgi:hypothetical protein
VDNPKTRNVFKAIASSRTGFPMRRTGCEQAKHMNKDQARTL